MRLPRIIVPGAHYHLTHRGNRRQCVFFDEADFEHYCHWLDFYAALNKLTILSFALMPNHVHLVAQAADQASLSRTIREAHSRHAVWINRRHRWTGHLWANRFFSSVLDEVYLRNAIRYVELNPVRAGLAGKAEDYRWSSAARHCGLIERAGIRVPSAPLPEISNWSAWLAEGCCSEQAALLRKNTSVGRPCGMPEFLREVENFIARPVESRPRGRPRKASK